MRPHCTLMHAPMHADGMSFHMPIVSLARHHMTAFCPSATPIEPTFLVAQNGGKANNSSAVFCLTYLQGFIRHILAYFVPPTNQTNPTTSEVTIVRRPPPLSLTHVPVYGENGDPRYPIYSVARR